MMAKSIKLQATADPLCPCAVCNRVLPGPEAAVRAVSGSAKKSEAEAVLHRAVNDALHLLSLLRLVLIGLLPDRCAPNV